MFLRTNQTYIESEVMFDIVFCVLKLKKPDSIFFSQNVEILFFKQIDSILFNKDLHLNKNYKNFTLQTESYRN